MSIECLNCGTEVIDHFCPHCGQKASVKRLTWKGLGEEVLHFFTHIEKGFLKTTLLLIIKPGVLCKGYLSGERKRYHKPVGFLLIWITVFLLLFNLANHVTHFTRLGNSVLITNSEATSSILARYRSLIEILILPFTGFVSWFIAARPRLNYPEVLSISFYITSFLFILLSIQFIISMLFGINFKTDTFDITTTGIFTAWVLYAGYDIYRRYEVRFLLLRLLLSMLVNIAVYFYLSKLIVRLFVHLQL
jgi:hypothetical protein